MDINKLSYAIIGIAMRVHTEFGSGMTESAYESISAAELTKAGHRVRRQVSVPLQRGNYRVKKAFRVDLIIDEQIVVEIKVVKAIGPHHVKQTVTYLKGLDLRLGLILNFGAPSLRYGIKRIVNSRPNAPK